MHTEDTKDKKIDSKPIGSDTKDSTPNFVSKNAVMITQKSQNQSNQLQVYEKIGTDKKNNISFDVIQENTPSKVVQTDMRSENEEVDENENGTADLPTFQTEIFQRITVPQFEDIKVKSSLDQKKLVDKKKDDQPRLVNIDNDVKTIVEKHSSSESVAQSDFESLEFADATSEEDEVPKK